MVMCAAVVVTVTVTVTLPVPVPMPVDGRLFRLALLPGMQSLVPFDVGAVPGR